MQLKPGPTQMRNPDQFANYAPQKQPEGNTFMSMSSEVLIGLSFPLIVGIVLCAVMLLPMITYQHSIVGTWNLVNTWTFAGREAGDPLFCIREFGVGGQIEFRADGSAMSEQTVLEYSFLDSHRIELSPYGGHVYGFFFSNNTMVLMNTGDFNLCIYQRSS